MRWAILSIAMCFGAASAASAQVLQANTSANNGGSSGWGIFFDLSSSPGVTVTDVTTFSSAAAGGAFSVEVFTRSGTGVSGPGGSAASGPGSSPAGWTSLGTAPAVQGATANGESLLIDIPDITVPTGGGTVGVAFVFTGAGPRYFGTGAAVLQTFSDANLSMLTGDSRTVPFTTTGSFFSSRGYAGTLVYSPIPEPASFAMLGLMGLAALRRRR